jgi:hypothetical protein
MNDCCRPRLTTKDLAPPHFSFSPILYTYFQAACPLGLLGMISNVRFTAGQFGNWRFFPFQRSAYGSPHLLRSELMGDEKVGVLRLIYFLLRLFLEF